MRQEIAKAQALTLAEWSDLWQRDGCPGARELSFLLGRASRLAVAIATDTPIEPEPALAVPEEPVTDPKEG